jgi:hypothetical protein
LASGGTSSGGSSRGGSSNGGSSGGSPGSGGKAPASGGATASGANGLGGSNTGGGGSNTGGSPSGGKSGGSGGTGNTAGGGASGVGGNSSCAKGQFLLCEDFESTAVGAIPTGWTKSGNPAVADDQAARGQRSLKLPGGDKGAGRILRSATAFGGAHYGRVFYRVSTPAPVPQSGGVIHSTLVAFGGTSPTGGGNTEWRTLDTVEDSAGMHQFIYNVQPSGAEFGKGSPYNWKYDGMWHCAEWNIDAATQTYRFYIDSAEVTQITISNGAGNFGSGDNRSEIPDSFSELRVGWVNYQSAGAGFTAWIDEVAIASSRIGCER